MAAIPNLGLMWILGFMNLFFSAMGLLAVACLVGIPLSLGAAAWGFDQEATLFALAYTSPAWAPIGAGFGLFTAWRFMRGVYAHLSKP